MYFSNVWLILGVFNIGFLFSGVELCFCFVSFTTTTSSAEAIVELFVTDILLRVKTRCVFFIDVYKPSARGQRPRMPGFLKLLWFACWCVCVCVSAPRPLITSGVIWCDIGCVQLVKQVLRLFPASNYFIQHLPSIKWMGVAILTQHIMNTCQRKPR